MKIEQFKKGTIIHRNRPLNAYGRDRSFIEDPIEVLKVTKNLLFYRYYDNKVLGGIYHLALNTWNDGNWVKFPVKIFERLKRFFEVIKYPEV